MSDKNELFAIVDRTAEFDSSDIEKNKVMGILSYLSILVLVPIFAAKDSKFARFHANQGLVLFILEIILGVVGAVIGVFEKIPLLGLVFTIANIFVGLIDFGVLVLAVIGIIFAAQGKAKSLPLIGSIKLLK